jgi:hypothetical protein
MGDPDDGPNIDLLVPEDPGGVTLPRVSAESASARRNSDFVDNRVFAVGFGIYLGGYHVYAEGLSLPVLVPDNVVDLNLTEATLVSPAVFDTRDSALIAVATAQMPRAQRGYAYYSAACGLIVPTIFGPATAPRTAASMIDAMRQLGKEVSDELVALAIGLVVLRILSGTYSRLVRASPRTGYQPARPNFKGEPTALPDPVELGRQVGSDIKAMSSGKRAALAQKITAARLSQDGAVTAVGEASRVAFGRISGTVTLPDGSKVVPSVFESAHDI